MALLGYSSCDSGDSYLGVVYKPAGFVSYGPIVCNADDYNGAHPPVQTYEVSNAAVFVVPVTSNNYTTYSSGVGYPIPSSEKVFLGMHIRRYWNTSTYRTVKTFFLALMSGAGVIAQLAPIEFSATSDIGIWCGRQANPGTDPPDFTIPPIPQQMWTHCEFGYDSTTGILTVINDGITIFSENIGVFLECDQILFPPSPATANQGGHVYAFDNFYICDGTGSTNNTFLGSVIVREFIPASVVSDAGWVTEAGGTPTVSKLTDNSDSTLLRAVSDGATMTVNIDVDTGLANILAAGVEIRHSDSGVGVLTLTSKHGADSELLGSVNGGHATIKPKLVWSETGPSGSSWTSADLDILEIETIADI